MDNEAKARKFLEYIEKNLPMLRRSLLKNITYNEDIFEDAIQDSIIKIFNSISKNGTEISSYEKYFFIVAKFTYIYLDNRKKRNDTIEVRDAFNCEIDVMDDCDNNEERYEGAITAIEKIRKNIIDNFGEKYADIYLTYMRKKSNGRTSYAEISESYGLSVKEISSIINEVKLHIGNDEKIKAIRKEYKEI